MPLPCSSAVEDRFRSSALLVKTKHFETRITFEMRSFEFLFLSKYYFFVSKMSSPGEKGAIMRSTGGPKAEQREGQHLQRTLTSRRQFLQWASGVASTSGIAWTSVGIAAGAAGLPSHAAQSGAAPPESAAKLVKFGDSSIRLTFDSRLHSGVAYLQEGRATLLAPRGVSEFVELADGQRVEDFTLGQRSTEPVSDIHGTGTQLTLVGLAPRGLEKTVRVRLYDRYPGFALYRVSYRNVSERPIGLNSW